jgi:hypothetical protein
MNWYKKAQTGEWWIIEGSAVFADGDVGEMNHEAYVIESIKRKYVYDEFDKGEYIEWDEFKKELALEAFEEDFGKRPTEQYYQKYKDKMEDLYLKKLKEMGMTNEEYALAEGIGDAREYGLKNLGWKRVKQNNIQTNTLTVDDLKEIANGLWDINNDLDENSDIEFNIEVDSTGAFYTGVPFKLISDGAPSQLRQYQQININKYMQKNNSWYRFAATKKIVLSPDIYNRLEELANRIAQGNRNWTPDDIQLQANNSEALEWFLRRIQKNELV